MTASGFLHILIFCGQAEKKKEEGPVHLFKSRPNRAHPLFKGFIAAALRYRAAAQRDMLHL